MSENTTQSAAPFVREKRYTVIKSTDIEAFLNPAERLALDSIMAKIEMARVLEGKAPLDAVVVESDWPEYEPTWKAIEARASL